MNKNNFDLAVNPLYRFILENVNVFSDEDFCKIHCDIKDIDNIVSKYTDKARRKNDL